MSREDASHCGSSRETSCKHIGTTAWEQISKLVTLSLAADVCNSSIASIAGPLPLCVYTSTASTGWHVSVTVLGTTRSTRVAAYPTHQPLCESQSPLFLPPVTARLSRSSRLRHVPKCWEVWFDVDMSRLESWCAMYRHRGPKDVIIPGCFRHASSVLQQAHSHAQKSISLPGRTLHHESHRSLLMMGRSWSMSGTS